MRLTLTNIALINGLQALLGAGVTAFTTGNIILGGAGSDIIEGRAGDDRIDGDAWLNVRISVRQNLDGTGPEIASFNRMQDMVPFMLDGTYNPGQLKAVREILYSPTPDFDTARFSGNATDYSIVTLDQGTLDTSDDVILVTDNVGTDGTDRLTHIERLQFSDQAVVLGGLNAEPDGLLTILDAATNTPDDTPTEDQLLRVSIAGVTDADNISLTNPSGAITSPVATRFVTGSTSGQSTAVTDTFGDFCARAIPQTPDPAAMSNTRTGLAAFATFSASPSTPAAA